MLARSTLNSDSVAIVPQEFLDFPQPSHLHGNPIFSVLARGAYLHLEAQQCRQSPATQEVLGENQISGLAVVPVRKKGCSNRVDSDDCGLTF